MNTFVVINCENRKVLLVTSSARKAKALLDKGIKIQVWSENKMVNIIYAKQAERFKPYVQDEREYIGKKQKEAEERNKRRFLSRQYGG